MALVPKRTGTSTIRAAMTKQLAIKGARPIPSAQELTSDWAMRTLTAADAETVCMGLYVIAKAGEGMAWQLDCTIQLVNLLSHSNAQVSAQAATTLRQLGSLALGRVSELTALLQHETASVRTAAASVLEKLGSAATKKCSSQLAALAADGASVEAQAAAVLALGTTEESSHVPLITKLLQSSPSAEVVSAACISLGLLGSGEGGEAMVERLNGRKTRLGALRGLTGLGERAPYSCSDAVLAALADPRPDVSFAAVQAIAAGVPADPAKIAAALTASPASVQERCALTLALGACGPKANSHDSLLEKGVVDEAEDGSSLASVMCGGVVRLPPEMRKPSCASVLALAQVKSSLASLKASDALEKDDWEARLTGLEAIKLLAGSSASVPSSVVGLLENDCSFQVRAKAAEVLCTWKVEDGVEALKEALTDRSESVRVAAASGIGGISPEPGTANEVFKLLQDTHPTVRAAALTGLSACGPALGTCYGSVIVTYLEDPDHRVRSAAIKALNVLDACGRMYIDELKDRLADPVREVRLLAQTTLIALGVEDAETVELEAGEIAGPAQSNAVAAAPGVDLGFSNLADFYKFSMEKLSELSAQGA